jgi:glycosyltransferase involved in cell wall biosynthesis
VTRLLLVCPEPLGHGQPAGIGIRFQEMQRVLIADGHRVTLLSRDDITPEALAGASREADAAIVQGHVANDFFAHACEIPTVIDLYDPFIVENLHYYRSRGLEVFEHDFATLEQSLLRGDFFLCASDAQRHFYLGMLLATGRVNPVVFEADPELRSLIDLAPFGVQPPRVRRAADLDVPQILFGGIYDWYEPELAIEAVARAREGHPRMTLTFTMHPNPDITPQGKAADAMAFVKSRGYESFVRFEPWAPYDRRGEFLDRFAAALLTFKPSLETDLSMRTRIYDYLWAGIPVVTSSAPGTDEILERYAGGIVVRSADPADYATAIARVVEDHEAMTDGTAKFVADHQWNAVLEPLRRFCRSPRSDEHKGLASRSSAAPRARTLLDRIRRRMGGVS